MVAWVGLGCSVFCVLEVSRLFVMVRFAIFWNVHRDLAIFCDTLQNFATYRNFLRHVTRRKRHVAKICDFCDMSFWGS
jgi:hypothetical protein